MTFADFFKAVWNKDPFPWQKRLADQVLKNGWPSIGLPTAAGKTTLIDIAVYALAKGSPHAARRIFFVVDRRIIVDEAADRAAKLAAKLQSADLGSPLWEIANALLNLGGATPLEVATLRGGIAKDDSWVQSPLQPTVICSTVDQIGSSLLFRAYGTSNYNAPIRAALAATDSLIILDEAHTSQPFAETLQAIARYSTWADESVGAPLQFVEMSATPCHEQVFVEDDADQQHVVLGPRWTARKKAFLAEPVDDEEAFVKAMAEYARQFAQSGAKVVGVICNRVRTAREIHSKLHESAISEPILLTGRARPYDRDRIWEQFRPAIAADRGNDPETPVFVVSTQCIEVGADISFDALVTEIASLDALQQRFGRLDRFGKKETRAVITARKEQIRTKANDPVYGTTIPAVWRWLEKNLTVEVRVETTPQDGKKKPRSKKVKDEFVEFGVLRLRKVIAATPAEERASLVMPRSHAPVLMPAHMDLLCQTSPAPSVSPEPALFLHGPLSGPPDVQVVWRADLDDLKPEKWIDQIVLCPPSAAEAISLPVWEVRKWLSGKGSGDVADIEGTPGSEDRSESYSKHFVIWNGPDESDIDNQPNQIRPGSTIVVPSGYGGCDKWGWNPSSITAVTDIGDAVKLIFGRPMLRLHPTLAEVHGYTELNKQLQAVEIAAEARATIRNIEANPTWPEWVRKSVVAVRSHAKFIADPDRNSWLAVIGRPTFAQDSTLAAFTKEVPLDEHLEGVTKWAERFSTNVSGRLRNTVIAAGRYHDIGKVDPRFQAWLRGGRPIKLSEFLAKSGGAGQNRAAIKRARELAGYPEGGRHELVSVALLQTHASEMADIDFDLLLHLVACHHGRCRPFAPMVPDNNPATVRYNSWSASTDHGLERAGSGVSERFWRLTRRYGWYGLAYLETLVRLADHRRSEEEQEETKVAMEKELAHA